MSSGGTPRQKMIGMMYLVLTALLALNVQKSVLEAFVIVNEGLEHTTENFANNNEKAYAAFEAAIKGKEAEKAKPYYELSKVVKAKSEELIKYIDEMKKLVIMETDKKPKEVADTLKLKNVDAKDNFDDPSRVLLGSEENPLKTRLSITDLKLQIEKLKGELIALFETKKPGLDFLPEVKKNMKTKIEAILATEDPGMVNGVKETWEMERVLHVPLAAVVCNLTAVQANIRNAEYEVVNQLLGSISANDFKFDKLVAKVLAEKSYIIAGDEYKADVLLVAFNSTSNPEIEIGNVDTTKAEDVNPMLGAGKPLEVYKGVGKYKAGSSGAGVQTWGGCIKVKQPNGNYKYYPFKSEYEVAPPALVVSPTFMNVFYKGVDNPVDISVPGVPSSSLTVTLEGGGSISPDPVKKGSYNVKIPGNAATKTKVVVSAKIGSAVKRMGEVEFRVKQIPDPVAEIANVKSSGNAPKSLLAQSPLIVRLPGFDFKIPPIAVKKYRFSAVIGGDLKEFSGSGSTLSNDMKSVIEKAKQNSKVIFSDIVVDMPDGRKDVPLNTIVVSIKG